MSNQVHEKEDLTGASAVWRPWLDALHVAGSIASVTGLSLLALRQTVGVATAGYLLAYVLNSSLLIAGLMLFIRAGTYIAERSRRALGTFATVVVLLITVPFGVAFYGIFVRLSFELFVPFIVLIVQGQYP